MKPGFSLRMSDGGRRDPAGHPASEIPIRVLTLRALLLDESAIALGSEAAGITTDQLRRALEAIASE